MKRDLEERTLKFAVEVRKFIVSLGKNYYILEDARQLVRASGSIGANYREANESLSKKDFLMRLKISRKEAKESYYRLSIILKAYCLDTKKKDNCITLIQESIELRNILSAIINKSAGNKP